MFSGRSKGNIGKKTVNTEIKTRKQRDNLKRFRFSYVYSHKFENFKKIHQPFYLTNFYKKTKIIKIYPQKEALKALGENQFLSKSTPYKEG